MTDPRIPQKDEIWSEGHRSYEVVAVVGTDVAAIVHDEPHEPWLEVFAIFEWENWDPPVDRSRDFEQIIVSFQDRKNLTDKWSINFQTEEVYLKIAASWVVTWANVVAVARMGRKDGRPFVELYNEERIPV